MTSAIDATKPADGVSAVKSEFRDNFAAAKAEIEELQVSFSGAWVSVAAYGATGDGVTDDTAAFETAQAALEAVGGGVILVPEGTYAINYRYDASEFIEIRGVFQKTIIKSFAADDWAIRITHPQAQVQARPLLKNLIFDNGNAANGLAIYNAIGADMHYCTFNNNKIGLLHRVTHYCVHFNCFFVFNDIAILFSGRGGAVTDPNTNMPELTDAGTIFNNSNKKFIGTQISNNRIGVCVDSSTSPNTSNNVFYASTSMEVNKVGICVLPGQGNDRTCVKMYDPWFEGSGDASGAPQSETVFGETVKRGDIYLASGGVHLINALTKRIHVEDGNCLIESSGILYANATVYTRVNGSLDFVDCETDQSGTSKEFSYNTPFVSAYPFKEARCSAYVTASFHGALSPQATAVFSDDCTGAAFVAGITANGASPSFEASGGPFGQFVRVTTTAATDNLAIDIGSVAVNAFYVTVINIKASAEATIRMKNGTWAANGGLIGTDWQTVCWVQRVESGADAITELTFENGDVTTTYDIAGISVSRCLSRKQVKAIVESNALPVTFS